MTAPRRYHLANAALSASAAARRLIQRHVEQIAERCDYDPRRMERRARLLDALDPDVAEAVRDYRVKRRVA